MLYEDIGDGSIFNELNVGEWVPVLTSDSTYIIECREDGLWISGHPQHCPEATRVFTALYRSVMDGVKPKENKTNAKAT